METIMNWIITLSMSELNGFDRYYIRGFDPSKRLLDELYTKKIMFDFKLGIYPSLYLIRQFTQELVDNSANNEPGWASCKPEKLPWSGWIHRGMITPLLQGVSAGAGSCAAKIFYEFLWSRHPSAKFDANATCVDCGALMNKLQ